MYVCICFVILAKLECVFHEKFLMMVIQSLNLILQAGFFLKTEPLKKLF